MATNTMEMISEASVTINAAPEKVWKALTTPSEIKKYLFGTNVETDWKVGSPINYHGEFNGNAYHDKGTIKKFEPNKLFQSTYWSSAGGKEDRPENYNLVTYTLIDQGGKTLVKLTQDNVRTEKEREHLNQNWTTVLNKLKEVVEKGE